MGYKVNINDKVEQVNFMNVRKIILSWKNKIVCCFKT